MNSQKQQFDTALANLSADERATYIKANPIVGVGGAQLKATDTGYTPINTTFDSSAISTVKPIVVTPPPVATGPTGFGAELTSNINNETKNVEAEDALKAQITKDTTESKSLLKTSADKVSEFLGLRTGKSQVTDNAYKSITDTGTSVDTAAKKLKAVNAKINAIDIRTQEQIKQLESAPGGLVSGKNVAVNAVQRQAASDKADLYIEKLIAQGDYDSAKSIADRKIDVLMEQDQLTLDKLKFDYEKNKDEYTKNEQRQFELMASDRQAKLDAEKDKRKTFETTKIDLLKSASEQNAPQAIRDAIARATTTEQAISAAGQYAGNIQDRLYKQGQIDKLNADNAKIIEETKMLGGEGITNPEAAKYSTALNVILGSSKFTKEDKISVIRAVNNGEDPFTVVKNQAQNIMGQTNATKLQNYEQARDQIKNISSLLSDYYANGGTTGIFTGNYEKTINKLGTVNDPKLVEIATNISAALQIYRNAVSGTAYSVQEGKDISSIFPGINKSEGLNNAILTGRLNAFDTTIDSQYRNTLGKTYDTLKESTKNIVDSKTEVTNIGLKNPEIRQQIKSLLTEVDPTLGRPLNYDEVLQIVKPE